ncbi:unnamed protein product [Plutella xylostella]|uniref:(diamondback moth) hypothetical protein n=1 Tax=Plutella xylostella TaxID=51655 RepID=A0A8S4F1U9_PLUXY|nr:unnamed protein product [Plutella xylostella]
MLVRVAATRGETCARAGRHSARVEEASAYCQPIRLRINHPVLLADVSQTPLPDVTLGAPPPPPRVPPLPCVAPLPLARPVGCYIYRIQFTQTARNRMREKVTCSALFRGRKALYARSVPRPFVGDYVRLRASAQWRRHAPDHDRYVVFAELVGKVRK